MGEVRVTQEIVETSGERVDNDVRVTQEVLETSGERNDNDVRVSQLVIEASYCHPPDEPTDLSASASGNDLILTWTDNSTTETGFTVQYSPDDTVYSDLTTTSPNVTTYTHTDVLAGASCGEDFYYKLIAEGAGCDADPVTYTYTLVAPTAPSDLSGASDESNAVLTWTDNSSGESGFIIYRSFDNVTFSELDRVGPNVTTYTDTNTVEGVTHYYKVSAYIAGCEGATSGVAAVPVISAIIEPCPPSAIYQLILYDPTGERLAIIDDYRSLQYGHTVNDKGFFSLQLSYNDSKRPLFEQDAILEIKRKVPGYLDWYTEFIGHCEDFRSAFFSNGNTQYNVVGSGFNGLLGRVIIGYTPGSNESDKDDVAETVMKEYVLENRGSLATTTNGREANANLDSFYVEGSSGAGDVWEGERGGKNLLQTIQDIANYSGIDFNVVTHPTHGVGSYLFETYENQMGEDRTTNGLNSATGLNSEGNVPHVFSLERGNVESATIHEKHKTEINRCYIFGRNQTTGLSKVRYQENATAIDGENLRIREAMRGGGSQPTNEDMDDLADEYLEENQFVEKYTFTPVDTYSSIYGLHYHVGDRLTLRLGDIERDKRLVRVSVTVSGGEGAESNKEFEFADIPEP